jgi:ribosomal protein S18 acetylase RimI-like enzyme
MTHQLPRIGQASDDYSSETFTSITDNSTTATYCNHIDNYSSQTFFIEKSNCTAAAADMDDTTSSSSSSLGYEPEVYFVAMQSNNDNNIAQSTYCGADNFENSPNNNKNNIQDVTLPTNNNSTTIMGIITIQLRHRSPLIAGPSTTTTSSSSSNANDDNNNTNHDINNNNISSNCNTSNRNSNNPSASNSSSTSGSSSSSNDHLPVPAVALPSPHYIILNLHVDTKFRKRGIASSLLSVVVEYILLCCEYDDDDDGNSGDCGKDYWSNKQRSHDTPSHCDDDVNGKDHFLGQHKGIMMDVLSSSSSSGSTSRGVVGLSSNNDELMNKLKKRQRNRRRRSNNNSLHSKLSTIDDDDGDDERIPIVLSVNTDNIAALRLYEKFGFVYLEQNDVFCMMILQT